MSVLFKFVSLFLVASSLRIAASDLVEGPKQPEELEVFVENSALPNDSSQYQLKLTELKLYKYLFNDNSKCREIKHMVKVQDPLDHSKSTNERVTVWQYDRTRHDGKYPIGFTYTKDDELVVDYGDECDIFVMFAGRWHFYGTGNLSTGQIINKRKGAPQFSVDRLLMVSLFSLLILMNSVLFFFVFRLYRMVHQMKLTVDKSDQRSLLA